MNPQASVGVSICDTSNNFYVCSAWIKGRWRMVMKDGRPREHRTLILAITEARDVAAQSNTEVRCFSAVYKSDGGVLCMQHIDKPLAKIDAPQVRLRDDQA